MKIHYFAVINDPCSTHLCGNGAVCIPDNDCGDYSCLCTECWTGSQCFNGKINIIIIILIMLIYRAPFFHNQTQKTLKYLPLSYVVPV